MRDIEKVNGRETTQGCIVGVSPMQANAAKGCWTPPIKHQRENFPCKRAALVTEILQKLHWGIARSDMIGQAMTLRVDCKTKSYKGGNYVDKDLWHCRMLQGD